jgi:hypothetical protein
MNYYRYTKNITNLYFAMFNDCNVKILKMFMYTILLILSYGFYLEKSILLFLVFTRYIYIFNWYRGHFIRFKFLSY